MYAADAVQAAVFRVLDGHISVPVHDYVPPGTPMPYVVLGHATETPDELHGLAGSDLTVTLHVWSDATGTREAHTILAEIDAALHHARLDMDGAHCWACVRESTEVMHDEDIETGRPIRHAVVRYRIRVHAVEVSDGD